ncbi:hypothetical protein QCA50_010355 [Cerrena zonata]|uniref:Uncharacterized protein n=1 Tax=Cerrena zonata TaxID=2478898 RepID=A0AAW0GCG8_9APHY
MSYDTTIPTVSDILKWCPTLVVPNPFPIKNVLHYVDSKSTLATCSPLFSKVVTSNSNTALADCLLTIAAPSDGFCLVQRIPPLSKLALHNTRFSLPEMANLLRWLPELEDFALVDPILTDRHQHNKFIYKDAFFFSLKILTVTATAHSESWPLTDYGLFLSRILPMFETIEHCNATYAEEDPSDLVIEPSFLGHPQTLLTKLGT